MRLLSSALLPLLASWTLWTTSANAAQFSDTYCKAPLCLRAIYDDAKNTVDYTLSLKGGGSPFGWVGIGAGSSRMAGANMMVGWLNADGSMTMSQRTTSSGHHDPTTSITAQAFTPDMTKSSSNSTITLFSWTFPVDPSNAPSKASPHIWAICATTPSSSSTSSGLRKHQSEGSFTLDLTKALAVTSAGGNGSGSNSNNSTGSNGSTGDSNNNNGGADDGGLLNFGSSSGGADSVGAQRDLSQLYTRLYLAHASVMSIAWMGVVVLGALVGRYGRTLFATKWFATHRALQSLALVLITIGFGLGLGAVSASGDTTTPDSTHKKYGIVLFVLAWVQGLLGAVGHMIFHRTGRRAQNFVHIVLGLFILATSFWQIHTGLEEWDWAPPTWIGDVFVPVYAGVVALLYLGGLALLPRERRNAGRGVHSRVGGGDGKHGLHSIDSPPEPLYPKSHG